MHREPPVVELLVLFFQEPLGDGGLQAERDEIWEVAGLQRGAVVEEREDLGEGDADDDPRPEAACSPTSVHALMPGPLK